MKKQTLLGVVAVLMFVGALSAAEPRVIFEDRFDGKLGEGWNWLRENPKTWRFKDGALEIRVEPGVAPTVKNALVRKAPDRTKGKYAVEVTITFTSPPTNPFEQAGITWYRDGKPEWKLVHELVKGKICVIPSATPTSTNTVELRLILTKDQLTAQVRPDGKGEFKTVGTRPLAASDNEQVSIQCYNGPAKEDHWMRFDDFRIVELPE